MRSLVVGVDAGGTSTVAVASRDGHTLEAQTRSGANASAIGTAAAAAAIVAAIRAAVGEDAAPHVVVVGAAGAGDAAAAAALRAALEQRLPNARIRVCDDGAIALRAGTEGDGIALIAGTGSYCYARVGDAAYRAGGYGYLLGDEGSGYAIGSAAMRVLLRALDDRGPRDAMTDALSEILGVTTQREAARRIYDSENPVAQIAGLAPTVLEHAARGERSAAKITQAAALELADLIKAIVRKADAAASEMPIVFTGGLLRANSLLTFLLETRLSNDFPRMPIVKNAPAPHFGALALAQELAG